MEPSFTPAPGRSVLWKIVQFPLTRIVLALVFIVVATAAVSVALRFLTAAIGAFGPEDLAYRVPATLLTVLVVHGAYRLYVRVIERRRADELSLRGAASGLGIGIATGALLFSAVIGVIWACGSYRVLGTNPLSAVIPVLLLSITSGYVEEVVIRGIIFRIMEDGLGTWIALIVSAVLFGLLHAGNPNASAMSTIAIALTAGVMLAAAYVLTRKLWVAIGIHFAWNFTQGGIYGVAVSGNDVQGLLESELVGSDLIAGGAFGAEASIFTIVFGLLLGVFLLVRAHRRDCFVRPAWRRPRAIEVQTDVEPAMGQTPESTDQPPVPPDRLDP